MTAKPGVGSFAKSRSMLVIKVLVSLGLLALVLRLNRDVLVSTFTHRPRFSVLLLGLVAYLTGVMLAFVRWWLLVRSQSLAFSLRDAFRLGWVGMFFNLVIPGAVGGDLVKGAFLAREHEHKGRAIASIVIDRLVALLGLFGLASSFGLIGWARLHAQARPIVIAATVGMAICICLLVLAFSIRPHGPLTRRLASRPRWAKRLSELHTMGIAYRRGLPWVGLGILLAFTTHFLNSVAFYAVIQAIDVGSPRPGIRETVSIVPLIFFSTAVPLPFSGLGVSENVSALLFQTIGYSGGAVAMIGFRLFQVVAAVIGAGVYLLSRSRIPIQPEPDA